MLLSDYRQLFRQYVTQTASFYDIHEEYVEKDYWLVLLLKHILFRDCGYIFKGGTSLSKCYHLINRFSEDIDISYKDDYHSLGPSPLDKKFKGITRSIKEVGLELQNTNKLRRNSYFNRFICKYDSLFDDNQIKKDVVIELAGQTPSFPSIKKPIQSFIGEYLDEIGRHDLTEQFGLEQFEVEVQSERTLVDKTFAICDYYLSNKSNERSRHIYDIHKILPLVKLDKSIIELFERVRKYRVNNPICYSSSANNKLGKILESIIDEDFYKSDYETNTKYFLYKTFKYNECIETLKILRDFLLANNY